MAGGHAAEILEAAEHGLDASAVSVSFLVVVDFALTVPATRDHGDGVLAAQRGPKSIGIIARSTMD